MKHLYTVSLENDIDRYDTIIVEAGSLSEAKKIALKEAKVDWEWEDAGILAVFEGIYVSTSDNTNIVKYMVAFDEFNVNVERKVI